jgi:hypothetical protein
MGMFLGKNRKKEGVLFKEKIDPDYIGTRYWKFANH